MAINTTAKMVIERYNSLKSQRKNWEEHWQEIADYFLPRKNNITEKQTKGNKRHDLIFDGTSFGILTSSSESLLLFESASSTEKSNSKSFGVSSCS